MIVKKKGRTPQETREHWNKDHCRDCSNKPLPGLARCKVCRETHNERERRRRRLAREALVRP